MNETNVVKLQDLVSDLDFKYLIKGNNNIKIKTPNVYQIGYELLGVFDYEDENTKNAIHIFGINELKYFNNLPKNTQIDIFKKYFNQNISILILSNNIELPIYIYNLAQKNNYNILQTSNSTAKTIRIIKNYLNTHINEDIILPGYTFLDIHGIGVLLCGYEEAKFGVTIELLERGHMFITDENVKVTHLNESELLGANRFNKSFADSHFFLLNKKNNTKIDITTHFGIKSTRVKKQIDLVVELEKWDENKFYDRLGLDENYIEILGTKVKKLIIPVKKGRNLAIIIETAAMNQRMKQMGENSAKYFVKESQKIISEKRKKGINKMINDGILVDKIKNEFGLDVLNGNELLTERYVYTSRINRPSLALSGYFDLYEDKSNICIQIFSTVEFKYLASLDEKTRIANLQKYLSYDFPMIITSLNTKIPNYFIELVREKNVILCASQLKSSQLVAKINNFLETFFSPKQSLHGVFVEMYGFGVMLMGHSGAGKSETALELIHRGHRLIADDLVNFVKTPNNEIIGVASNLPYFMEIRGLGIIDIKAIYGLGAVRINKKLDLVIELKDQENDNYSTNIDYKTNKIEIMGNEIPKIDLYISSGRNAAAMVEIAVMNIMARKLGHDPEIAYKEGLNKLTKEEKSMLTIYKN